MTRPRARLTLDPLEDRYTPVIIGSQLGFPDPLAVGGNPDGTVRIVPAVFGNGQYDPSRGFSVTPFPSAGGTVRVAYADVNGDGVTDLICGTGPGVPARITVLDGRDSTNYLVRPFDPFGDANFTGGTWVAGGDVDNDRRAEVFASPDSGGGPRVTMYAVGLTGATLRANFFGLDDPAFRGGVRLASADVNADSRADLVVAAGLGGGPRVAVYDGRGLATVGVNATANVPTKLVPDFYAFPGSDATTLRDGVFVAAGDVNGDRFADLVFGGGPGGGPRVLVLSGATLLAQGVDVAQANPIGSFFAGDPNTRGGVRVAAKTTALAGRAEVVTGSGDGQPPQVRAYYQTLVNDFSFAAPQVFDPLVGGSPTTGLYVG